MVSDLGKRQSWASLPKSIVRPFLAGCGTKLLEPREVGAPRRSWSQTSAPRARALKAGQDRHRDTNDARLMLFAVKAIAVLPDVGQLSRAGPPRLLSSVCVGEIRETTAAR